jgi:thioredoxin 1
VLSRAAEAYAGEALVVKLEVNDAREARSRFDVDSLPQFLFFRDGKLVARAKGMPSEETLRPWVDYLLGRGPRPISGESRRERGAAGADGRPVTLTDAVFQEIVLNADVPVLVDFWAAWCGPCRAVAPAVEQLAQAHSGQALIAKLDVDANQATARRYGVMSVPTLIFFNDGQEVDRVVGAQPRQVLQEKLEALL